MQSLLILNMRWLLLILTGFCLTGCFNRFAMSDKQIREYYKDKPVKPVYFTIQNDSVSLFCAATGADTLPPLLLIHGAPGAWYGNRSLMDDSVLQQHYHIISVDRPGYHRSTFNGKKKAVTSIDRQAVAIHEALRINRSKSTGVVLGSSYGGPIAAAIAARYPQSFHHLVMLAPAMDPDIEKFWWFNPLGRSPFVKLFLPRYINHATDEKYAHIAELRKLMPVWDSLQLPVTVVQGGADKIVNPANLDFARKHLAGKNADFIYIPDAGHLIRFRHETVVRNILVKAAGGVAEEAQ
ncbi:MAG: alpha/beta hydrolase [Chitinophagaceae bacterium]